MFKKITYILIIIFSPFFAKGQITDTIELSYTKSVYLIFSEEPKVDQGSEDIITRTHGNKVIIQAGVEGFEETNLFVQSGAEFYMFILKYVNNPNKYIFNYQIRKNRVYNNSNKDNLSNEAVGKKDSLTEAEYQTKIDASISENTGNELVNYEAQREELKKATKSLKTEKYFSETSQWVEVKKQEIFNKGSVESKISMVATNFYVDGGYFFLKLYIKNSSKIKYDIDFIRFSIKNVKKAMKKQAQQYIELEPIYVYNEDINTIDGKSSGSKIFVFEKFTIENNKKLNIEMWEMNGDRKLDFDFLSEDILKIKTIN